MDSSARMLMVACSVTLAVVLAAPLAWAAQAKGNVDSGMFAVYVNRQQVATERFQIQQTGTGSTVISEFKLENGQQKSSQKAELQLTPMGDLRRYEWRELGPGKAHLEIEPSEDILIEQISPNPPEKTMKYPFMVARSTVVLDDYSFVQREILAWRYMAQACNGTLQGCKLAPLQFGALVPQQHAAALVTVQYAGLEKVQLGGKERELNRLNMKVDEVDWILYLDGDLKLIRIVVPSAQTDVVRY